MQMAMLLAALCSGTVAFAFQLPLPRTRFGCEHGSRAESPVVVQQQSRRAVEVIRSTIVGRSLYGTSVGSSGSEEIEVRLQLTKKPAEERGTINRIVDSKYIFVNFGQTAMYRGTRSNFVGEPLAAGAVCLPD